MVQYHAELIQGSDEWKAQRAGILTASEMKYIISPKKLGYANNDKERAHLYELAAQRITGYVEPAYVSDAMLRGQDDEIDARELYHTNYAPVQMMGFITNDKWDFTLGYSPDGLVGEDGLIEIKSRGQKYHMETLITDAVPDEHVLQLQTGLLVSERKWIDYISYCGGLPMKVIRVLPDERVQSAILEVSGLFHEKLETIVNEYTAKVEGLIPTERRVEEEIML